VFGFAFDETFEIWAPVPEAQGATEDLRLVLFDASLEEWLRPSEGPTWGMESYTASRTVVFNGVFFKVHFFGHDWTKKGMVIHG